MEDQNQIISFRTKIRGGRPSMSDHDELLVHARRYFQAAAQGTDRRKMQVLVMLGLDYLKLAAKLERSGGARRRIKRPKRQPSPALIAEERERLEHVPP